MKEKFISSWYSELFEHWTLVHSSTCWTTLIGLTGVSWTIVLIKRQSPLTDNNSSSNLFIPPCGPEASPCNIKLSVFPPPLSFCPVESQSPWEAGSGCREAAHISRQSPILCQKGDTFQTGPAIYHQEPVFLPAPLSHTSALKSCPGQAAFPQGEANKLMSSIEPVGALPFLCTVAQWVHAT